MTIKILAAICALLLIGCAATPDGDSSNDTQVASAEASEETKSHRICTREKPLGSNLPRVVCYTRQPINMHALDPSVQRGRATSNRPRVDIQGRPGKPNG